MCKLQLKSIQLTAIDLAPIGGGGGPEQESDDEGTCLVCLFAG